MNKGRPGYEAKNGSDHRVVANYSGLLIGRAGASPPSHSAGADFYIFIYLFRTSECFSFLLYPSILAGS